MLLTAVGNQSLLLVFTAGLLILGGLVALFGVMAVAPNQARVLLLFGDYKGSVKDSGFFWVNPFFSKKKVSLRIRNFDVAIQSESALRNLASRHPYDSEDDEVSLQGNTQEISEQLRQDIQERLKRAGVEVIEARISHLAYSAEIAAAMLQASAGAGRCRRPYEDRGGRGRDAPDGARAPEEGQHRRFRR